MDDKSWISWFCRIDIFHLADTSADKFGLDIAVQYILSNTHFVSKYKCLPRMPAYAIKDLR